MTGQALAETALVLPVLLLLFLGMTEAGILLATYADQGRTTGELARWAAMHPAEAPGPGWDALVAAELAGCTSSLAVDAVGLVRVAATCTYRPAITSNLWDGLPITTDAIAAVEPSPSPEPEASP